MRSLLKGILLIALLTGCETKEVFIKTNPGNARVILTKQAGQDSTVKYKADTSQNQIKDPIYQANNEYHEVVERIKSDSSYSINAIEESFLRVDKEGYKPIEYYINNARVFNNIDTLYFRLVKIPPKTEQKSCLPISCSKVNFQISPGKRIGTHSVNNNFKSEINWQNTVNVTNKELAVLVNNELADLGFNIIGINNKKARYPKILLKPIIKDIKYNISNTPSFPLKQSDKSKRTLFYATNYETICSLKIQWKVLRAGDKKTLHDTVSKGKAFKHEKGGTAVIFEAFNNALYKFLNQGKFYKITRHKKLSDSTLKANEKALSITKTPESSKKNKKDINKHLNELIKSVVTLQTNFGHGSGFLISENGYVITNYHVVSGSKSVKVSFASGITLNAEIKRVNKQRDLALLQIKGSGFKPLPLKDSGDIDLGREVYAIGTPTDPKLGQTVTRGIVSNLRKKHGQSFIQTDVSISKGNSGGPLINNKGEVIGIVTSKVVKEGVDGIGFAIPVKEAIEALNIEYK